jgi:hypothetical protein
MPGRDDLIRSNNSRLDAWRASKSALGNPTNNQVPTNQATQDPNDYSSAASSSSAPPSTQPQRVSDIKSILLKPAFTSTFRCKFDPPPAVKGWMQKKADAGIGPLTDDIGQTLEIMCCDASLPGSTLSTIDINDDRTGVTEKHAYRRMYDDRADFTFYVDRNYEILMFFEAWMSYIANEQISEGSETTNYSYRFNYPSTYQTRGLSISKFEKDSQSKITGEKGEQRKTLEYKFIDAFPISINSVPVSYEASNILKVTVSFTYKRFILKRNSEKVPPRTSINDSTQSTTNPQSTSPGNPENSGQQYSGNPKWPEYGLPYVGRNKGLGPIRGTFTP